MSYFNQKRLPWVLVALLAALNIGLLAFFWLGTGETNPHPRGGERPTNLLVTELKLDAGQQETYAAMREAHFESIRDIDQAMRQSKDALFKNLKTLTVDTVKVNSALRDIQKHVRELDEKVFWHFRGIREICSEQQALKFDEIILDILHGRRKGGRPGPGRKGGPPPHHRPPQH